MQPADFVALHRPALERDAVRHNVILSVLERLAAGEAANLRWWTLGPPGACATQSPGFSIMLGAVTQAQCRTLAEQTRDLDFPGVVGSDKTAHWFVDRARELGLAFNDPIPQQIHALREPPRYPGAPGRARPVEPADADLFADWMAAFIAEAVPHDRVPGREQIERMIGERRYQFWVLDEQPVSMAGIVRRVRHVAAIAGVYTPPALRKRGYAGSVTAAVVEQVFAEGKTAACLYTDLRNPASNRCYAKIGFKPECESWLYVRAPRAGQGG